MNVFMYSILAVTTVSIAFSLPTPAVTAQETCVGWTHGIGSFTGEGEGMSARACPLQGTDAELVAECHGETISLRYAGGTSADKEPHSASVIEFITSSSSHEVDVKFEEQDGMFASYPAPGDPLLEAMKTNAYLLVQRQGDERPESIFTLEGSRQAIEAVEDACR